MTFIDFNDTSIPVGKRKVAYVKWAMSKGTKKIQAQRQANRKFGYSNICGYCGMAFNSYKDGHSRCPYCFGEE